MIVLNSLALLEHLSEIEEHIQKLEALMQEFEVDCDKNGLLELLVARQREAGRQKKIS